MRPQSPTTIVLVPCDVALQTTKNFVKDICHSTANFHFSLVTPVTYNHRGLDDKMRWGVSDRHKKRLYEWGANVSILLYNDTLNIPCGQLLIYQRQVIEKLKFCPLWFWSSTANVHLPNLPVPSCTPVMVPFSNTFTTTFLKISLEPINFLRVRFIFWEVILI